MRNEELEAVAGLRARPITLLTHHSALLTHHSALIEGRGFVLNLVLGLWPQLIHGLEW